MTKINTQTELIKGARVATILKQRSLQSAGVSKRVRTRRRLLAATTRVMEQSGYEGLTIDAIVHEAGVARGTFYLYFSDKSDAALAVIRVFSALMRIYRPRGGSALPAIQSIYNTNLFYSLSYAANSRLLAGRESLMRDRPDLVRRRDAVNVWWTHAVLRDLCRRTDAPSTLLTDPQARLTIRAVISMADEFLREIYVYKSPALVKLAPTPHHTALALSQVWHRAIFGCDPEGWEHKFGLPTGLELIATQ